MTQQHPFQAFYESIMAEPMPKMPKFLEDAERAELRSTSDRPVLVKALCGELKATLVADGSFTLERENALHIDLNSFELLWHLKQTALQQKEQGIVRLLQATIACDPTFALQHIFLGSMSLKTYIENEYADMPGLIADEYADMPGLVPGLDVDEYADMPGLVPVEDTIHAILARLEAKRLALQNELAFVKAAIALQEENRALEASIRELQLQLE